MTTAYSIVAEGLEAILNSEFAAEQLIVQHDNIHDSLGADGGRIGIAPVRELPRNTNQAHLETTVQVKFLGAYNLQIDPKQAVDPRIVVGYAERFRRAVERTKLQAGPLHWFMTVTGIEYPNDPTGNKTRFTATVVGHSQNSGLVETVA